MIIYFADRQLNIIGQASTSLPKGLAVTDDKKTEEIETGVNIFECSIPYDEKTRETAENCTEVGNYILRSCDGENEFYTIIEAEKDTKSQTIYIYAEDAGLDLLNEVYGEFEADKAYDLAYYVNKFAADSGFVIGINEAAGLTRKLSWDGEATAADRIASAATQFDGCEISYTFEIKGLVVTKKYINIYKQRGKDIGIQMRLNKEVDSIITTKSIANLATALLCEGGVPDNAETPITLSGYKYDDGDFYVDGKTLKSRTALNRWHRYLWKNDDTQQAGGHIVKPFSYDTTSQATLCAHAITELKKIRDMEVNYEIKIKNLPDNVKIGDRVNIIDDTGELYLSSRILKLETSIAEQEQTATLGEYLLKTSGISARVAQLAAEFAANAQSVKKALSVAKAANTSAEEAKTQAEAAANEAAAAQTVADEAKTAAESAAQSAGNAQAKAEAAQAAVDKVEESVVSLGTTVANAQAAADYAKQAAETAQEKAKEAENAATNAQSRAEEAENAAGNAQTIAEGAIVDAATAKGIAEVSKTAAEEAIITAKAAKLDAEQAEADVASLGDRLTTVAETMEADYARKTELTETTAHLQSKIEQNAAEINSTATLLQTIDETANNAQEKAAEAQAEAKAAQLKADEATAQAEAAQLAADEAAEAATAAQAEADTARAAADTAQSVADKAAADLESAKIDLATVSARADATEAEIAEAQAAVDTAQETAANAKVEADEAAETAKTAQTTADTAAANAWKAQATANAAKAEANIAQKLADKLNSDSEAAQSAANNSASLAEQARATAEQAQVTAQEAQTTANAAVEEATNAKSTAEAAVAQAKEAQKTAEAAALEAEQAAADLARAEEHLAEVLADVESTEEEVAAAQTAVETAQAAANSANTEAENAQAAADQAKADAEVAQERATEAAVAASAAQDEAHAAQDAADEAQAVVDGLAVRVTKAESNIKQNAREIIQKVSAVEEATTANGKSVLNMESTIRQLADSISMLVTDGNGASLMTQTADGGWTFSTANIQSVVDSTSQGLNDLTETVGNTNAAVDILNAAVEELGVLSEYVKIGSYTYIDENGEEQTEPSIDLGESDTGFKLKITNTRILFTDGTSPLVSIDSKEKSLIIQKATIESELQMGGWVWQARNNGKNLGLVWKGVVE